MTDNHNYEEPEPGQEDWHVPLNKNFEQLDRDVEIRDIEENRGDYDPASGAKFFATDTERRFIGEGENWVEVASSGQEPTFSSVQTREVNGEIYATEFEGEGLDKKVDNAVDYLISEFDGRGRVRVTPKDDGTPWQWESDIVWDFDDGHGNNGIHLDIDRNVKIEYTGSGTALKIKDQDNRNTEPHTISGGVWEPTADDADICFHLQSVVNCLIEDCSLHEWTASDGECTGIYIQTDDDSADDGWSELNTLRRLYIRADRCIDMRGSDSTGQGDRDSLHGHTVSDVWLQTESDFCLRLAGGANVCDIRKLNMFARADGVNGIVLDNEGFRGTAFTATQMENVGGYNNVTAVHCGPNFDGWLGSPIFYSPWFEGVDNVVTADPDANNSWKLHSVHHENGRFRIMSLEEGESNIYDGDGFELDEGRMTGLNLLETNDITLADAQTLKPSSEPSTPSGDDVVLWNDGNSLKVKFSDGSAVTIAEE